jgi:Domain of unknown function (DUF4349)
LESLLGQQRVLADKVAFATVTVSFEQPTPVLAEVAPIPEPPAPPEDRSGFLDGLRTGWSGLVAIAIAAGAVVGFILPFAPLLALAAFVAWRIVVRRRRAVPPAPAGVLDASAAPPATA